MQLLPPARPGLVHSESQNRWQHISKNNLRKAITLQCFFECLAFARANNLQMHYYSTVAHVYETGSDRPATVLKCYFFSIVFVSEYHRTIDVHTQVYTIAICTIPIYLHSAGIVKGSNIHLAFSVLNRNQIHDLFISIWIEAYPTHYYVFETLTTLLYRSTIMPIMGTWIMTLMKCTNACVRKFATVTWNSSALTVVLLLLSYRKYIVCKAPALVSLSLSLFF